ncbi:MAG: PhoH family protein [Bacteroidota bacterium]|jgi:phosphate starvation-inducible PhoH-like protein
MIEESTAYSEVQISTEGIAHVLLFGLNDENLRLLDQAFPETKFNARGERIKLSGPEDQLELAQKILVGMLEVAQRGKEVREGDVKTLIRLNGKRPEALTQDPFTGKGDVILYTHRGEPVRAKTPGQVQMVKSSAKHDILFAIGPAGTGKTYTSVALAVKALKERKVQKIILARPAVEAGETLGFLPGDLREKIDPYLRPLYDALEDMLDQEKLNLNLQRNVIEIAPLAYMRGRTLNNAFVILDEAQNATNTQMKMFLTRIGFNSRAIITGDITQTDLPRKHESGLISIQRILKDVEGIDFVYLDEGDVVRHKLVKDIINAYDRFQPEKE